MSKVISFHPFRHRYTFDGKTFSTMFVCPKCGSRNCEKCDPYDKTGEFLQGYYKCSDCGNELDLKGRPLAYYSTCFIDVEISVPKQLSLF